MDLNLQNINWQEFLIGKEFNVQNSKAYHKSNLQETKFEGIVYVSRTNLNNGLEAIVKNENYKANNANTIVFGAENATFFYQPTKYITGNKMYFIENKNLNKYTGLFIQMMLNKSINNCGYGYGKGLTGSRAKNRYVLLPATSQGNPDYDFMEAYMQQKEQKKIKAYKDYISKRLEELKRVKKLESLKEKEWKEFFLHEIFPEIQRGKRLKKDDHKKGKMPYISSTALNNGVDGYIGNKEKVRIFKNCLTLANSGSVGACFYQPFECVASDHVTKLQNEDLNKYTYQFIATIISRLNEKYSFNREINDNRIKKEKIMLPINKKQKPDYEYMENYMKELEYRKLRDYLERR